MITLASNSLHLFHISHKTLQIYILYNDHSIIQFFIELKVFFGERGKQVAVGHNKDNPHTYLQWYIKIEPILNLSYLSCKSEILFQCRIFDVSTEMNADGDILQADKDLR